MRRNFVKTLDELLEKDKNIILLAVDIGYGVLELLKEKYPENFINTGIAEQNTVSVATGLALKGKIPFVYTINPFIVFRALEQVRMASYMNQHVIFVGTGREDEYTNQGISHYSFGDEQILNAIPNLKILTPEKKEDVAIQVREAYKNNGPFYIRLSRF